ncbi:hypothetical protein ACR6C2_29930 [Streptomyces sp. INA 01156]
MSYLGIDIGGTKTALLLERSGARPAYARFDWPAEADADADLAALAGAVSRLIGTGGPAPYGPRASRCRPPSGTD